MNRECSARWQNSVNARVRPQHFGSNDPNATQTYLQILDDLQDRHLLAASGVELIYETDVEVVRWLPRLSRTGGRALRQDRRTVWKSCCRLRRSTSKGRGQVSDSGLITHFEDERSRLAGESR